MKKILFIVTFVFLFSVSIQEASAKTLPQAKPAKKTMTIKSTGSSIAVTPKLRKDRKALLVYFSNLQNAQSVSYMLIYKTNGQEEGAGGSVNPAQGSTATRELLFGTCSKNVCRHHNNITNMRLEITAQLKSGKKIVKRYRIRA